MIDFNSFENALEKQYGKNIIGSFNSKYFKMAKEAIQKQMELLTPTAKQLVVMNLICKDESLKWQMREGYMRTYLESTQCYLKINRDGLVINETLDNIDDDNSDNWISGKDTTINWIQAKRLIIKNYKLAVYK